MTRIQELRLGFAIKHYQWAQSCFEHEIDCGFPLLRSFCDAGAVGADVLVSLMKHIQRNEKYALAHGLLRRVHVDAVTHLKESTDPLIEKAMVEMYIRRVEEELRKTTAMQRELAAFNSVGKKVLRTSTLTFFRERIGKFERGHAPGELEFHANVNNFRVRTIFHTAGGINRLSYWQNVETIQGDRIAEFISVLKTLGICGTTTWTALGPHQVELALRSIQTAVESFCSFINKVELPGLQT